MAQEYSLDNTNITATIEARDNRRTACTIRHGAHSVTCEVPISLSAFEFEDAVNRINELEVQDREVRRAVAAFPDWNLVIESVEDDWSPVD